MISENLLNLIEEDEGYRQFAYDDATGKEVKAPIGKLTFGYGWNIQDVGIEKDFALLRLRYTIDKTIDKIKHLFPSFILLDEVRQAVLINVAFNTGLKGLLNFKKMLNFVSQKRYADAGIELLDSSAARKLVNRYSRLSRMMITGKWQS